MQRAVPIWGDKELHLTSTEYKLLCLMAKIQVKVLTHTYITQKVWGSSWENDIASLRVFMATLRKKLERRTGCPSVYTDPYRDRVPHDQSRVIIYSGF